MENLYYPLQTIKLKPTTSQKLNALYPKDIRFSYGQIELNILDYKLHRGQKNEWINLDQVLKAYQPMHMIENPKIKKNLNLQMQAVQDRMVALVLWKKWNWINIVLLIGIHKFQHYPVFIL